MSTQERRGHRLVAPATASLVAVVVAAATSPWLAIWWLAAGVATLIVGGVLHATHRPTALVTAVGAGMLVGGLLYVVVGLVTTAVSGAPSTGNGAGP
jgi:uncharacterized membrane protein YhhN